MKQPRSLRWSVTHYIPAKKRKKKSPKPKQSAFVKFLSSLENRGPLHTVRGPIWEKLTQQVRRQMESAGTWPQGMQETDPQIIAEYVSRLQSVFWISVGFTNWQDSGKVDTFFTGARFEEILQYRIMFRRIYTKIRNWGMRNGYVYLLDIWFKFCRSGTLVGTWIYWDFAEKPRYGRAPEHYHKSLYIEPFGSS